MPQIEVTFAIDSNGIVNVSARDLATGKAQGMQINPAGGLSQTEIDKIIKEASAFAEADHERREIAAIKNRLEGMIASNERVLAEFGGGLADDERGRIEETLKRSREIASGESREAFNEAIFDMQGVSKVLTRVMLAARRHGRRGGQLTAISDPVSVPIATSMSQRDYYEILGVARDADDGPEERVPQARADVPPRPQSRTIPTPPRNSRRRPRPTPSCPTERSAHGTTASATPASAGRGGSGFPGFDASGFADLSDLFGGLFGFASGGGFGGGAPGPTSGSDLVYRIQISFRDAAFGVEAPIVLSRLEACEPCGGTGAEPGTKPRSCPACGGRGRQRLAQGFLTVTRPCPNCQGEGRVIEKPCSACRGEGRRRARKELSIRIPAGVESNSRLRLTGEGDAGPNGGPSGDLYVVLTVAPDDVFSREGDDLVVALDLPFPTLVLGGEVPVPTLDGEETLTVPAGTAVAPSFDSRDGEWAVSGAPDAAT